MDFALLDSLNRKSLQKFSGSRLTHSVPRNQALVPCGCPHAAHRMRPSFRELYFRCLGKHSKTETSFKMNFFPMKGKNSITSYCIVLTFKSAKIQWVVKKILVSEALGTYFKWIMMASITLMTQIMGGCLIPN